MCDPRLNARQSLDLAFRVAELIAGTAADTVLRALEQVSTLARADRRRCRRPRRRHGGGHGRRRRPPVPPGVADQAAGGVGDARSPSRRASSSLDDPVGQPGCTLRHLLAHAGGYPFEGSDPIARPERRRIYSNTGIEMVADGRRRSGRHAVRRLRQRGRVRPARHGRRCELRGSAAHARMGDASATSSRSSPSCSARRCWRRRRRPTPFDRSIPTWPVSCRAWGASIRAHGDWASRSVGPSHRTGPARRTTCRRSATSAAPAR